MTQALPFPRRIRARVFLQASRIFCLQQEGRRSADRRHPTKLRTIGCGGVPLSLSPPPLAGEVGRGRARLSALHRGTRQAGRNQHWLSSRPALPETRLLRALPVVASLESTEHLGDRSPRRSVGGPKLPGKVFQKQRAATALAPLSGSHLESTLQRASFPFPAISPSPQKAVGDPLMSKGGGRD